MQTTGNSGSNLRKDLNGACSRCYIPSALSGFIALIARVSSTTDSNDLGTRFEPVGFPVRVILRSTRLSHSPVIIDAGSLPFGDYVTGERSCGRRWEVVWGIDGHREGARATITLHFLDEAFPSCFGELELSFENRGIRLVT